MVDIIDFLNNVAMYIDEALKEYTMFSPIRRTRTLFNLFRFPLINSIFSSFQLTYIWKNRMHVGGTSTIRVGNVWENWKFPEWQLLPKHPAVVEGFKLIFMRKNNWRRINLIECEWLEESHCNVTIWDSVHITL